MRNPFDMRRVTAGLVLAACAVLSGAAADPGILLELDLARFEIQSRDLRDAHQGPALRVVIGSPAHPTPEGSFPLYQVIRNPRWTPGEIASDRGAKERPPSSDGPLGIAKLSFGPEGVALHGGAKPVLLGKPASLGCVRALDKDLLALLDWLDARGALGARREAADGEVHQAFRRPARIVVR
jgi:hypothetical protein